MEGYLTGQSTKNNKNHTTTTDTYNPRMLYTAGVSGKGNWKNTIDQACILKILPRAHIQNEKNESSTDLLGGIHLSPRCTRCHHEMREYNIQRSLFWNTLGII